jgi:aldose sugar dehydrogenase
MSGSILRVPSALALATALTLGGAARPGAQVPAGSISSAQATFVLTQIVPGLEHPWGMAFLPDGNILITERPGRLRIVRRGVLDPTPIGGVPAVFAEGQGGLLDIALHPHFEDNRLLYLTYAAPREGGAGISVAMARFQSELLEEVQVIFEALPFAEGSLHFGSRLAFGPDGLLYVTLGDRGDGARAQDLQDLAGKIVRLLPDGGVPPDNPFVDRTDAAPQIFSYGHLNPQGLAIQPETGVPWAHEHGPMGGDEINVIRPGANYGWPVITHGVDHLTGQPLGEGTHKEGMAQPIYQWGMPSIAPSAMTFYQASAFPEWRGDLLVAALAGQRLVRIELEGEKVLDEEPLLAAMIGRIRDIEVGPDGSVFLLTDDAAGALWRLAPAPMEGADGKASAGADGKPGDVGSGRAGADGKDGMPGADASDGRPGADGADGGPGDASDGMPGADSEGMPSDGADGTPGADGDDGRSGADGGPGRPSAANDQNAGDARLRA